MNPIESLHEYLFFNYEDQDLYLSLKDGKKYRFVKPAPIQYQGEAAYYEDIETGKIKLLCEADLKSLKRKVPSKMMQIFKEIEK